MTLGGVAGQRAGSIFAFLAQHRQALFPAEMFANLFPCGRGRPSVAARWLTSGGRNRPPEVRGTVGS